LCREKQIHAVADSQRRIKKSQHQSKPSRTEEPCDSKGRTQSGELGSWLRVPLKKMTVEKDRAHTVLVHKSMPRSQAGSKPNRNENQDKHGRQKSSHGHNELSALARGELRPATKNQNRRKGKGFDDRHRATATADRDLSDNRAAHRGGKTVKGTQVQNQTSSRR
jgi:hypothetical protein